MPRISPRPCFGVRRIRRSASAALTAEPVAVKARLGRFARRLTLALCSARSIGYEQRVDSPEQRAARRVVAIGNFDGVHVGHQTVLRDVAEDALRRGLAPAMLTFAPHPLGVLGRPVPAALTSLPRKAELVRRVSPAITPFVRRFDRAFAAQSPEEFVADTLVARLGAAVVVVGENFRFGRDREGDLGELSRLASIHGFEARTHGLIGDEGGAWSSSRARAALARGDLDEVTRTLGRPHMISGVVVTGDQRGRTIGFPTANVAEIVEALPPNGVYAVLIDRADDADLPIGDLDELSPLPSRAPAVALARGVANIGVRPTITPGETAPRVEAHLFDVNEDLYGARLRVHLVARIREEMRFPGLDALKAQIARDAEAARAMLATLAPDPRASGAWR
jgi:riboflavin kinase / FMN adenylyltransferase